MCFKSWRMACHPNRMPGSLSQAILSEEISQGFVCRQVLVPNASSRTVFQNLHYHQLGRHTGNSLTNCIRSCAPNTFWACNINKIDNILEYSYLHKIQDQLIPALRESPALPVRTRLGLSYKSPSSMDQRTSHRALFIRYFFKPVI